MARLFVRASSTYCYQNTASTATSAANSVAGWYYEITQSVDSVLWSVNAGTFQYNEIRSVNGTIGWAFSTGGWNATAATISQNTWAHVATTNDPSGNSTYTVYVNGVSAFSGGGTGSPMRVSPVVIGAWSNDPSVGPPTGSYFDGRIADFATWNACLTAAEVVALANGARPSQVRPQTLATYFPLDGLVSPEPNLASVNKTNGTLSGTSAAAGPPLAMLTGRSHSYEAFTAAGSTMNFRRTLSHLGTRSGSRQVHRI